jgi:hypothetical protein
MNAHVRLNVSRCKGDGDDGNVDDKDDKENQKVDGKKGRRWGKGHT